MSKKLVVIRTLRGGIKRHTLRNAIEVTGEEYVRAFTDHFKKLGRARLHLLDCKEIRCIWPELYQAILAVHKRLAKHGHRLVISAGDNAMRYSQYNQVFCSDRVDVFRTEDAALQGLRTGSIPGW